MGTSADIPLMIDRQILNHDGVDFRSAISASLFNARVNVNDRANRAPDIVILHIVGVVWKRAEYKPRRLPLAHGLWLMIVAQCALLGFGCERS